MTWTFYPPDAAYRL